jgi:hypothetical protein
LKGNFISLKKSLGEDKTPLGYLLVLENYLKIFVRAHTCPHVYNLRIVSKKSFLV